MAKIRQSLGATTRAELLAALGTTWTGPRPTCAEHGRADKEGARISPAAA